MQSEAAASPKILLNWHAPSARGLGIEDNFYLIQEAQTKV